MKRLLRYAGGLALVLLAVILFRRFCMESCRITTAAMEPTLLAGYFVVVNKMPGFSPPQRGNVVLFRSPLEQDRDDPPLFVGRIAGIPGDTVRIAGDGYHINGQLVAGTPLTERPFRIQKDIGEPLKNALHDLHIPYRCMDEDSVSLTIRLTPDEETKLRDSLSRVIEFELIPETTWSYTFVIPEAGDTCCSDTIARTFLKEAIRTESAGRPEAPAVFSQPYYWIMTDREDAVDSRRLGLIPAHSVAGTVAFCWYSNDWKRIFRTVR